MELTLGARNQAPAMDKPATDELATDELAKNELVTVGLPTDELAIDALLQLLASKLEFVPLVDLEPPKETKSITSSPGTTTILWWLKAFRKNLDMIAFFQHLQLRHLIMHMCGQMLSAS